MGLNRRFRASSIACGAVLLTVAALAAGGAAAFERTADVCVLGSAVATLCASVLFYLHWHASGDRSLAWLVAVSAAMSLQKLNWFVLIQDEPHVASTASVYTFQIMVTAALGTLLIDGSTLRMRIDPLALGLLVGLAVILARIGVLHAPARHLETTGYVVTLASLCAVGVWNAYRLLRSEALTYDLRRRIAVATVFLSVGQVTALPGSNEALLGLSALVNSGGGAMILATAFLHTRLSIRDDAAVRLLCDRLATAQHDLHSRQAQLHEIRATIAGISTATELQRRNELSPQRSQQLHEMTVAELQRLHRLVSDSSRTAPEPTELDATLRPIVLRHEAQGLRVRWEPSGHVALGRPDDIAEIVNILLSNAARHAPGRQVSLDVLTAEPEIQVAVADDGPGIDSRTRARLFAWGFRGPQSEGQGVGLASARVLAEELGGRLELDDAPGQTRFVLSLRAPASVPAVEAQDVRP